MRPVVIVLPDVPLDRGPSFLQVFVLADPDLFLLQAAVEALDVAVALWVVVGGAAMSDAQLGQRLQEAGRPVIDMGGPEALSQLEAVQILKPCSRRNSGSILFRQRCFNSSTAPPIPCKRPSRLSCSRTPEET